MRFAWATRVLEQRRTTVSVSYRHHLWSSGNLLLLDNEQWRTQILNGLKFRNFRRGLVLGADVLLVIILLVGVASGDEETLHTTVLSDFREAIWNDDDAISSSKSFSMWFPLDSLNLRNLDHGAQRGGWMLSVANNEPTVVSYLNSRPIGVFYSGFQLAPIAGGVWSKSANPRWPFWFNSKNLTNFMRPSNWDRSDPAFRMEYGDALSPALDVERISDTKFNPCADTLIIHYRDKDREVSVRRYTPVDQQKTGLEIAEFLMEDQRGPNSYAIGVRGPKIGSSVLGSELPLIGKSVHSSLKLDEDREAIPPNATDLKLAGDLCWRALMPRPEFTSDLRRYADFDKAFLQGSMFDTVIDNPDADKILTAVTQFLQRTHLSLVEKTRLQGEVSVVDPSLKWVHMMRAISPGALDLIQRDIVLIALSQSAPSRESVDLVFDFIDALGDAGYSSSQFGHAFLERKTVTEVSFLAKAGLEARWMKPVSEEAIAVIIEGLRGRTPPEMSSTVKDFSVETIIRLDRADQLESDDVDDYWVNRIESVSATKRWSKLSEFARTESGRQQLYRILRSVDPSEAASDAVRVLLLYANGTAVMGRWDFMDDSECNYIIDHAERQGESLIWKKN